MDWKKLFAVCKANVVKTLTTTVCAVAFVQNANGFGWIVAIPALVCAYKAGKDLYDQYTYKPRKRGSK